MLLGLVCLPGKLSMLHFQPQQIPVMKLLCCCIFLLELVIASEICRDCWEEEIFTQPAVGIEFGLHYARAVLRWPNDTVEQVTMVPGSAAYQNAMRSILHDHQTSKQASHSESPAQQPLNINDPSPSPPIPYPDILEPLTSMAQTLKSKLDHVLPGPIAILGVSHPPFLAPTYQALLLLVIRNANLNPTLSYHQISSPLAASAACYINLCKCPMWNQACIEQNPIPSNDLILNIDFSEHSFTIFMYESWHPEDGITYIRTDDPEQSFFFWSDVADILTAFHNEMRRRRIDYLVLSGSLTEDSGLHEAIQKGLGARSRILLPPGSSVRSRSQSESKSKLEKHDFDLYGTRMADPVLAVSQGAAELGWRAAMRVCMDPCEGWRKLPQCSLGLEEKRI